MPNHNHDHADHDHEAVEHIDAAATFPEREPVRIYGTMPTTILATTAAIVALGTGSPLTALGCATVIVSPPASNPLDVPTSPIRQKRAATRRRRGLTKRRGPRRAPKARRAPSAS